MRKNKLNKLSLKNIPSWLTRRRVELPLIVINLIFAGVVLALITHLPFGGAPGGNPDEITHYNYNVKFIIENGRLPVSGQDDLEAYSTCRDNQFGRIPCIISYTIYPAFNYLFSAGSAVVANALFGVSYEKGARLASLMWGLIFINALYLIIARYIKDNLPKYGLLTAICFIPQVVYISSYINQDIHSLAISALFVLSILRLKNLSLFNLVFFGIATGLVLTSKYNYFIFLPAAFMALLYFLWEKRISMRQAAILCGAGAAGSVVIAGFWFVRNYFLYKDPLGQGFMLQVMQQYHELGRGRPISLASFAELIDRSFFETALNSFYGQFGYMAVLLSPTTYELLRFGVFAVFFAIVLLVASASFKRKWWAFGAFGAFVLATISLFIFNAFRYDYQPQGRYLFPVLVPLGLMLSYYISRHRAFQYPVYGLLLVTLYTGVNAATTLIRYYYQS